MVLHIADDLIGFVSFARNEDDVARTREHHGRTDRLGPVGDAPCIMMQFTRQFIMRPRVIMRQL